MNEVLREHLVSGFQTALATFLVVLGATLQSGSIEWTVTFWSSVFVVAARAAVKEVFARLAPPSLGGRK